MVLCVILAHGRYNNDLETTDVKIPYNIRLIQYTHPAIELSNPDAYYILNQLINGNFSLYPSTYPSKINVVAEV